LEASSSKLNKKKVSHRSTDSGFKIPVKISQEIAEFCSWDIETPRARIDVTNYICKYIKENDLQNPANRKIIVPDDRLQKLLAHNEEQHGSLTYASIQKLLAPHYTKITADA
jgi:chromatin remodeling complex protein RSC6